MIEDTNQIKCMMMDWMEMQSRVQEQNQPDYGSSGEQTEHYRNYRSRR